MEPFDQIDPPSRPPQQPKMPIGKVVLINFGIMLAYMLLTSLTMGTGHEADLGILAADAFLVIAQVGLNMLIGFILVFTQDHKQLGGALMISGIVMGVVGFGSCMAHMVLLDA
jgi:ABC-type polysaccharide/polyol phosphate export permease